MIGSPEEPVVEESRATIDAQMDALTRGTIPVVMLPIGSTYIPPTPYKMRAIRIPDYAGEGTYIFDPEQINVGMILALVKAGRHHELLGHVQAKRDIVGTPVIVQAIRHDGAILQDSVVSDNQDLIARQIMSLKHRFPQARVGVVPRIREVIEQRVESRQATNILQAFKQDDYRIGDLQAVGYLRTNTEMFPEGYLGTLYARMKTGISGKPGYSYLERLFCGMSDLSYDVIVPYLASRPLCIMGIWENGVFDAAGFIFPTSNIGMGDQKAAFAGYGFFRYCHGRQIWGSEQAKTLATLGLSFFFVEMGLEAIHGIRYSENGLTKNFLAEFGFQDTGRIPRYMLRKGKLVEGVASSLLREDFEAYVENRLIEDYEHGRGEHGEEDGAEPERDAE